MSTVRFKTDFRGASLGEEREVSNEVADHWASAGFVDIVNKAKTMPSKNKRMGRPKGSKNRIQIPAVEPVGVA